MNKIVKITFQFEPTPTDKAQKEKLYQVFNQCWEVCPEIHASYKENKYRKAIEKITCSSEFELEDVLVLYDYSILVYSRAIKTFDDIMLNIQPREEIKKALSNMLEAVCELKKQCEAMWNNKV